MGENQLRSAIYVFPAKRSVYFFDQHQTQQKRRLFFFRSIFPPKDLVYFSIKTKYNMKT